MARRLESVCREASLVARIGGDEFAVILPPPLHGKAAEVATNIIAAIGRPFECNGHWFKIGASIGIAVAERGQPHDLFKQADAALYAAKASGRNTFRIFNSPS
jgi:diguanylate cyclase (GGDEF)-like protein